jgi:hypothetical protein
MILHADAMSHPFAYFALSNQFNLVDFESIGVIMAELAPDLLQDIAPALAVHHVFLQKLKQLAQLLSELLRFVYHFKCQVAVLHDKELIGSEVVVFE